MTKLFIKEIYIKAFGNFSDKSIKFDEGFNLIYGENESGKSSICDFIEGVLYGFDDGKKVKHFSYKREKYRPLSFFYYSGFIIVQKNEEEIKIERNFDSGDYSIYNFTCQKEIESVKSNLNYPGEFLLDLDYGQFLSIVKNYQMQVTEENDKEKIIEKISTDSFFSSFSASEILNENLRRIGTKKAFTKPYAICEKNIYELNEKLSNLKRLREEYFNDFKRLDSLIKKENNDKNSLVKLKEIRNNQRDARAARNYKEEENIKKRISDIDKELINFDDFEDYNKDFFDNIDKMLVSKTDNNPNFKRIFNIFYIGLFILSIVGIILSKYVVTVLSFVAIFVIFYYQKKNDNPEKSREDILKDYGIINEEKYLKLKKDFFDFSNLKLKKENALKVLELLSLQEKSPGEDQEIVNIDLNEIEKEIVNIENSLETSNIERLSMEKNLASTEKELDNETTIREELDYYNDEFKKLNDEIKANNLALELLSSLKDNLLNKDLVSDEVSQIIRNLTNNKYDKIIYDKNLNVSIKRSDGKLISLDKLSTGFLDQINFALKFTVNKVFLKDKFIIFDDAFINFDDQRLRNAIFYLLDIKDDFQILYFTCQEREKYILKREEIYVNEIRMEDVWFTL